MCVGVCVFACMSVSGLCACVYQYLCAWIKIKRGGSQLRSSSSGPVQVFVPTRSYKNK